jgi:hypothetical protein
LSDKNADKFYPNQICAQINPLKFIPKSNLNFQPNLQKLPYKKEIILLNFIKFAQNIDIKKPFG